jgi:hypothetical protein
MATGLITAEANSILTDLGTTYSYIQLHVGDPGSAGTANVATETDRVQATWTTPASGAMANSGAIQWTNVAGTEDYTHFSVWTASTSGSCGWTGTITANAVTTGDNFTIPDGDLDVSLSVAS